MVTNQRGGKMNPVNRKDIVSKTFSELEREQGIVQDVLDIPDHYLGIPPSKFYKEKEVDYEGMRKSFDATVKRMGLRI